MFSDLTFLSDFCSQLQLRIHAQYTHCFDITFFGVDFVLGLNWYDQLYTCMYTIHTISQSQLIPPVHMQHAHPLDMTFLRCFFLNLNGPDRLHVHYTNSFWGDFFLNLNWFHQYICTIQTLSIWPFWGDLFLNHNTLHSTAGAWPHQVKFTLPRHLFTHLGFPSVRVVLSITFIPGIVMIMD